MPQMSDDSSLVRKFRNLEPKADNFFQVIEEIGTLKTRQEIAILAIEKRREEIDLLFISLQQQEYFHRQEAEQLNKTRTQILQRHEQLETQFNGIEERISRLGAKFDAAFNQFNSFITQQKHNFEAKHTEFEEFILKKTQIVMNTLDGFSNRVTDELTDRINKITKVVDNKIIEANTIFICLQNLEHTLAESNTENKQQIDAIRSDLMHLINDSLTRIIQTTTSLSETITLREQDRISAFKKAMEDSSLVLNQFKIHANLLIKQINQHVTNLFTEIRANSTTIESKLNESSERRTNAMVDEIRKRIDDFLRGQRGYIENMDSRYQATIAVFGEKIENIRQVSIQQSSSLNSALEQLKNLEDKVRELESKRGLLSMFKK